MKRIVLRSPTHTNTHTHTLSLSLSLSLRELISVEENYLKISHTLSLSLSGNSQALKRNV
jgi:hypothetical protein